MVLEWFDKSKKESLQALLAKKNYTRAIELIKLALRKRRRDERLRIQLADVLIMAGRKKEAIEILYSLADDLALGGFAGKAIAIFKRVQKLDPGQPQVEEKLAYLLTQQDNPAPDPWRSGRATPAQEAGSAPIQFDMEEISDEDDLAFQAALEAEPTAPEELMVAEAPGPAPSEPEPPSVPEPSAQPPSAAAAEPSAAPAEPAAAGPAPPAPSKPPRDQAAELHDVLVGLVEDVFKPASEEELSAGLAAGGMVQTPLFRDFSKDELVAVIRGLELRNFEPGEIVMSAGEPGDSMFILTTGMARAYMRTGEGRHVQLRLMTDGDFFGEISILTGGPRTATVTAVTPLDVLELDKPTLDEITKTHPRVRDVLQEFYSLRARHTAETARKSVTGR
jgi:hypothetical protein